MNIQHKLFFGFFFLMRLSLFGQTPATVTLSQGKFICENKPWFALSVNYKVDVFTDDETTFWVGPHQGYSANNLRCCQNQMDARMALFADFARIREMGFNTIRISGLELYAQSSSVDKKLWMLCKKGNSLENIQMLSSKKNNKKMASMAKIIIEEAHDAGLQVILLAGGANMQRNRVQESYAEWLGDLCDSLKTTHSLFAIDIYNEPIHSNSSKLKKPELFQITKKWYATIKKRLPKTLVTIGLVGPEDIVGWDPEALMVDFINFHLYPSANDYEYVASALYWISQTAKIPWIIGETGYSGSDDTTQILRQGSETDQKNYALFSLNRSLCRGAQGFSWASYRDIYSGMPNDNMGLINHAGKEKSIVTVFKRFNDFQNITDCPPQTLDFTQSLSLHNTTDCPLPDDLHYYRMEFSDYLIRGIIENEQGKPIGNAVICGWDKSWKNFRWTVSDKNGKYRLGSDIPMNFVQISAAGCNVVSRTIGEITSDLSLKTVVLNRWSETK